MTILVGQHPILQAAAASGTTAGVNTNTSGSAFLAIAYYDGTFTSLADNKGNTYGAGTLINAESSPTFFGGALKQRAYLIVNGAGGTGHTWTLTTSGSAAIQLFVIEITGGLTASILDANPGPLQDGASPFTSNFTGTLGQANELIICFAISGSVGGTETFTWGNSFTAISSITDANTYYTGSVAGLTVAATTSIQASLTLPGSGTNDSYLTIWSFKEATGGSYSVTANQGSYTISGQTTGLIASHNPIIADPGSYTLTGQTTLFNSNSARVLTADYGTYFIVGNNALVDIAMNADFGSYSLTGQAVNLTYQGLNSYTLVAAQGSYTYTGQNSGFFFQPVLTASQGQYSLTGKATSLVWSNAPTSTGLKYNIVSLSKLRIGL